MKHKKIWTIADSQFMKKHFFEYTNQELAEKLGFSVGTIQFRAKRLGLKRENLGVKRGG